MGASGWDCRKAGFGSVKQISNISDCQKYLKTNWTETRYLDGRYVSNFGVIAVGMFILAGQNGSELLVLWTIAADGWR